VGLSIVGGISVDPAIMTTVGISAQRPGARRGSQAAAQPGPATPPALRNIRIMHLLEWIAGKFNEAGIPIMAFKGAALYLTLYRRPDDREMTDLDLIVKPDDVDRAMKLLEDLGYHRGEAPFREDFFPRYYYEVQYRIGSIRPVSIDLHVRPFRVLRFSRFVPDDALWGRAVPVAIGKATVLVPAADDMLIHLAAHSAIHGNDQPKWLVDIDRWIRAHRHEMDWERFLATVESWRLAGAVRSGIEAAQHLRGRACPAEILRRLTAMRTNWRDRLALWHAPRDRQHLTRSSLVNALTSPGIGFVLGYLRDVLVPDRKYLGEWCTRHRCPWPGGALVLRYFWPVVERVPHIGRWLSKVEARSSPVHGLGVFATRDIDQGEVIARYRGRPVDRDGIYVSSHADASGHEHRHEITGPLKYLNHSCRPNAELGGFRLKALVPIRAGHEITMDYGDDACDCDREARQLERN
jgi:hypothetical protein